MAHGRAGKWRAFRTTQSALFTPPFRAVSAVGRSVDGPNTDGGCATKAEEEFRGTGDHSADAQSTKTRYVDRRADRVGLENRRADILAQFGIYVTFDL